MEYATADNKALHRERREPEVLRLSNRRYLSLRQCNDLSVLEPLEKLLQEEQYSTGQQMAIVSWYTPPFGEILGYGIYTKQEAEEYSNLSKEEKWGSPRFGLHFDVGWFQRRIERVKHRHSDQ